MCGCNEDNVPCNLVYCKDCKFAHMTCDGETKYCDFFGEEELYLPKGSFCSNGEKKAEVK